MKHENRVAPSARRLASDERTLSAEAGEFIAGFLLSDCRRSGLKNHHSFIVKMDRDRLN
jgi:hypothetical protein